MTHWLTRIIVSLAFLGFAAAFVWETYSLMQEYAKDGLWFRLAVLDSQNFIFFPVAGIAALMVFWRPATVAVDAFARGRLPFGRPVLLIGLAGAVWMAMNIATAFNSSSTRSLYEVAPEAILNDTAAPAVNGLPPRAAIDAALERVRIQARMEEGLAPFRDSCDADMLAYSRMADDVKYCFAADAEITVRACCRAKSLMRERVNALNAAQPSKTGEVHKIVLPIKVFFLIILFFIGMLLASRRQVLRDMYSETLNRFSLGVPIGAAMMLIWPLMNAAYASGVDMLLGDGTSSAYRVTAPLYTLAFGAWALMLLFYHLRSYPQQTEMIAKMAGVIGAVLGIVQYDLVVRYITATLGVGADTVTITIFTIISVGLALIVVSRRDRDLIARLPEQVRPSDEASADAATSGDAEAGSESGSNDNGPLRGI